ncbi:MAG: sensor histidine kinase [Beutenbergiaceae bacterium]
MPFSISQARRLGPIRRWFADHPRGADIVVLLVFVLFSAPEPLLLQGSELVWIYLGSMVATAVALMYRRRFPLVVLAIVTMLNLIAFQHPSLILGVTFAIYTASSLRSPRTAWLTFIGVTGVSTLGATAFATFWSQPWLELIGMNVAVSLNEDDITDEIGPPLLFVAANNVLAFLIAHSIGLSVRARRQHTQSLVDRANRMALERDQREQLAVIRERSRIAREMHDVVAHSLSVMVALSDGATATLDRSPQRSRAALTELSSTGREALAEMRRILGVLHIDDADEALIPFDGDRPLAPTTGDVDDLVSRFRAAGLPVRFHQTGKPLPSQQSSTLAAYRIVQESLTNVLRHVAGPELVEVELSYAGDLITVTITNTGGRPTDEPGTGKGLVGMRERAAAHGGSVDTGPTADGWRVHAELHAAGVQAAPTAILEGSDSAQHTIDGSPR